MRIAPLALLPLLLLGCSQSTQMGARFLGGRLAFDAVTGSIGCIQAVGVTEARTGRVMWETIERAREDRCIGGLPLFYGDLPGLPQTPAAPLVDGVEYEISGTAESGNSFHGRFIIDSASELRVRDVPEPAMDEMSNATDDIANNSQ